MYNSLNSGFFDDHCGFSHPQWVDVTNNNNKVESVSASKADSASVANSKNEVNCLAFCLGISNAKSASAADSESRTNSPSQDLLLRPTPKVLYTPPVQQIIPPVKTTVSAGTQCIDNTGSIEDEGYMYGYYDAQGKNGGISEHGKHTDTWRQGYKHGFADGFNDEAMGVYRNPC
jgi:hypothetical protein